MQQPVFFLGGYDLEMITIRELLISENQQYFDKRLTWGAKASAYVKEILNTVEKHCQPVLIELENDLAVATDVALIVDHHGSRAGIGRRTSLEQVFDLLQLDSSRWTRWHSLVAANDRGYIEGMLEIGASQEEVAKIRSQDRAAQGVTKEQEIQAAQAVAACESLNEGSLTLVRLAHDRTSAVTDLLHKALGGPGFENLLILCPNQINFFGKGRIVMTLHRNFPRGWYGGALPTRGFWGIDQTAISQFTDLIRVVEQELQSPGLSFD